MEPDSLKTWIPFLMGLCAAIGLYSGLKIQLPLNTKWNQDELRPLPSAYNQKIQDVLTFIQSKYMDSVNMEAVTDESIRQLLQSLDPYSNYISAGELQSNLDEIDGDYSGIGIEFYETKRGIIISSVQENSPAFKVGLEAGDQILEIQNVSVEGKTNQIDTLISLIKGTQDAVRISWKKNAHDKVRKAAIKKENLNQSSLGLVFSPDNKSLYIHVNIIGEKTYSEFMRAIEEFIINKNCENLIIDLRNNHGGVVHVAADILNQLIPEKDQILFSTKGNNVVGKVYKSLGKNFFRINKIIVLINGQTASAAEIIAGSLQDLDRATIIGQPSFGKATVLEQYNLPDRSAIRLAVSRYYLPSGRSIQRLDSFVANENIHVQKSGDERIVFKSKNGKPLPANNGIIPDVLIQIASNDSLDLIEDISIKWVLENFQEIKNLIKDKPNDLRSNPSLLFLISEIIKRETPIGISKKVEQKMQEKLFYSIAKIMLGSDISARWQLEKDPAYLEALQLVAKN
ncbi:MAG: S41 family peptidase [Bacteroidota bacterium]|nr:S41 family peptidase [Bacteroidota bacterium]